MTKIGQEKAYLHGHLTFDPESQKISKLQSGPTSVPKMEHLGPTVLMLQMCTN